MKGSIAAVAAVLLLGCAHAPRDARCLGPSAALTHVVYLHGVDAPAVSEQENHNRAVLSRIASTEAIDVALPRATLPCPNQRGSLCWGWSFDDREVDAALRLIDEAANACFADRPYVLVGFSNGGYLLSKLVRTCALPTRLPRATATVTIGASMLRGPLEPVPASLIGCGRILMLAGDGDAYNADPSEHLATLLRAKGAEVTSRSFHGGHSLDESSLRQGLKELLRCGLSLSSESQTTINSGLEKAAGLTIRHISASAEGRDRRGGRDRAPDRGRARERERRRGRGRRWRNKGKEAPIRRACSTSKSSMSIDVRSSS